MIGLHFQEICTDMKLAGLWLTIYILFMELYAKSLNKKFITQKFNLKKD